MSFLGFKIPTESPKDFLLQLHAVILFSLGKKLHVYKNAMTFIDLAMGFAGLFSFKSKLYGFLELADACNCVQCHRSSSKQDSHL